MGDPKSEGVKDRLRHAILHLQPVTSGKTLEACNTDLPAPRSEAKGIEVVDTVGDSKSSHKRCEADTA